MTDRYELTDRDAAAWMRVRDADGIERAAVLAFGGYVIHLGYVGDGLPLVGDHTSDPADDSGPRELVGLSRALRADSGTLAGRASTFTTAALA